MNAPVETQSDQLSSDLRLINHDGPQEQMTLVLAADALTAQAKQIEELKGTVDIKTVSLHKMRHEIAKLREALEWRPIEEAPKDGTWILAKWQTGPGWIAVFWHPKGYWLETHQMGRTRNVARFAQTGITEFMRVPTKPGE